MLGSHAIRTHLHSSSAGPRGVELIMAGERSRRYVQLDFGPASAEYYLAGTPPRRKAAFELLGEDHHERRRTRLGWRSCRHDKRCGRDDLGVRSGVLAAH